MPALATAQGPLFVDWITGQPTALVWKSLSDFGAVGDGVVDDTAAIQSAINSLPATGGVILVPLGNYKITSTINIGNGTSSSASTRQGVLLVGLGVPILNTAITGYTVSLGPKFTWAGPANQSMFAINGPLFGWGFHNIAFDGQSIATVIGLQVISAAFGDCRDLSFIGCFRAVESVTVEVFGGLNHTDSLHNAYYNIMIQLPDVTGATGFLLTGSGSATPTSDTDYNDISNVTFASSGAANKKYGFYLQVCDSNNIRNVQIPGGDVNFVSVSYDFNVNSNYPNSNNIDNIDFGSSATAPVQVGGTPATSNTLNYIRGIVEGNGSSQSELNGLQTIASGPVCLLCEGSLALTAQAAAIADTTLFHLPNPNALYRVSYYIVVTSAGTSGTIQLNIKFNDVIQLQTLSSPTITVNPRGLGQGSFLIRTNGVSSPTYGISFNAVVGAITYNVYLKVEKLD
jgi:Pectate lyase superfamily protein